MLGKMSFFGVHSLMYSRESQWTSTTLICRTYNWPWNHIAVKIFYFPSFHKRKTDFVNMGNCIFLHQIPSSQTFNFVQPLRLHSPKVFLLPPPFFISSCHSQLRLLCFHLRRAPNHNIPFFPFPHPWTICRSIIGKWLTVITQAQSPEINNPSSLISINPDGTTAWNGKHYGRNRRILPLRRKLKCN